MRPWQIVDTPKGKAIVPTVELECPFDGTPLLLHQFSVYSAELYRFKHADVKMKCPKCGFFVTFGVPISDAEMKELRESPLHGKVITDEAPEIAKVQGLSAEEEKEIADRLEKWGYW